MNKQIKRVTLKDYKKLFIDKKKIYAGYCIFYYKKYDRKRVAKVSASKRVGKAHERNYYKRRVRQILRTLPLKENTLILAIVLKSHKMAFEYEEKYLARKLRPLISES